MPPQADHHRQASLVWRGQAGGYALCRAPIPQGSQQSSGKFPSATAQTIEDDTRFPISRQLTALHLDLFRASKSLRYPTSQTIRTGHSHSSRPRDDPLESRHRCLHSAFYSANVRTVNIALQRKPLLRKSSLSRNRENLGLTANPARFAMLVRGHIYKAAREKKWGRWVQRFNRRRVEPGRGQNSDMIWRQRY
jgi:hypothetical protein